MHSLRAWIAASGADQAVGAVVQYLTNALRSGSINANTLLRGESLQNEAWLQETFK